MPCQIKIKQLLVEKVKDMSDHGLDKTIKYAKQVEKEVNSFFNSNVVYFTQEADFIGREITISDSLVKTYYDNELSLEQKADLQRKETGNYDVVDGEIVVSTNNGFNNEYSLNDFQEEQKELDEIVEDINNTNQDIKYQLSKEQSDAIDNVFDENPELANAVYSVLGFKVIKESDITYTDEEGKTCAEMGLTTNQNPKFGDWEIIKDLKGSPTHKQGGIDLSIKGNTIEAEGNELVLKNSVGDLAIIPKKDRLKIKDLIADNNEKALNNYISALPKNPNKAGDGGIYSDKYVKNNFFNRIFRRNNILEKQIMDENRSLYNVGKLKDFKILEATGKSKQHLEKTNRNPEYFPKGDTWFPYLDDVSQPIKLPNKNKYRTLVNDDNLSDDQLKNAVKFDFISHSLHNDKRYNDLSTQLSQKLLTKYDQKFIDNNGGVDAYVRGILSDSEDYKPYKDETSFIEPEFINEFKNYIKTGK